MPSNVSSEPEEIGIQWGTAAVSDGGYVYVYGQRRREDPWIFGRDVYLARAPAGELVDLGKRQTFTAGMYACRPPGMVHGPYRVPRGCMTLELRYAKNTA